MTLRIPGVTAASVVQRNPPFALTWNEYDRCLITGALAIANQMLDAVLAALPLVASGAVAGGRIGDLVGSFPSPVECRCSCDRRSGKL